MIIGNRVAEKDIRSFLEKNGFYHRSAKFEELELHATQRPGWLQVFRFRVRAKRMADDCWLTLNGVMRDDERFKRCEIRLFENANQRNAVLTKWSDGLVQPKFRNHEETVSSRGQYFRELAIFSVCLVAIVFALAMLGIH